METIKLKSRYRDVDTLYHHINDTSGIITSNGNYVRCILDNDNKTLKAVDFEGGPMISVGEILDEIDKKVKNIKVAYYVEFE